MEKEILVTFLNWIIANEKEIFPQKGMVAGVDLGPHLLVNYEPYTVEGFVEEFLNDKG